MRFLIAITALFLFHLATVASEPVAASPANMTKGSLRLPIRRRNANRKSTPVHALAAAKRLGLKTPLMRRGGHGGHGGTASEQLTDYLLDVEYYAEVEVGTPGQKFKVDIDTGSADFWIYSTGCKAAACLNHVRFKSSSSKTFAAVNATWQIAYVDGSFVSGDQAHDSVTIGGIVVRDQSIGLATAASNEFKNDVIDGLFGLSFPAIARLQGPPVFQNMIKQKLIKEPVFSVWLGKQAEGGGGEIVFGEADSGHHVGEILYVPVTEQRYWSVKADGVSFLGADLDESGPAIIDTGSTVLILPVSLTGSIHAKIPGAVNDRYWGWLVPCDTPKKIPKAALTFYFGGKGFNIPIEDLVREQSPVSGMCFSAMIGSYSGPWLLGAVFIKNNYCVFDAGRSRVGFAPVKK
ncbi:uncharacterized protein VTP21DRAFT_2649 [Calcarisporiella thermophila]|uniref:uncharacterized protein n=1 Tax=Calcarisporiella thermophila TaxID=911321 RepID=UPI00374459AD